MFHTYLSIAEYLVLKSGQDLTPDSIILFPANKMSAQQCSDFVANIGKKSSPSPAVVILDNIHAQGSKIMQILCKLETTIEETPMIVCTSHQTEYLTDLMDTFHFAEIRLGDDGKETRSEKYFQHKVE